MSMTENRLSNQYELFLLLTERLRDHDFENNQYYQDFFKKTLNEAFALLRSNESSASLTSEQVEYVIKIIEKNTNHVNKKMEWFLFRYCKFLCKLYSQYRLNNIQNKKKRNRQ